MPLTLPAMRPQAGVPNVPLVNVLIDGFNGTPTGRCPGSNNEEVALNNTSSNSPNSFFAVAGYDLCTGWGSPNERTPPWRIVTAAEFNMNKTASER
jgi:hypothetical protein